MFEEKNESIVKAVDFLYENNASIGGVGFVVILGILLSIIRNNDLKDLKTAKLDRDLVDIDSKLIGRTLRDSENLGIFETKKTGRNMAEISLSEKMINLLN